MSYEEMGTCGTEITNALRHFWWCVRTEMFPFSDKILQFAVRKQNMNFQLGSFSGC